MSVQREEAQIVATHGHTHGHQRAGFMAADGQISISLDTRVARYRDRPISSRIGQESSRSPAMVGPTHHRRHRPRSRVPGAAGPRQSGPDQPASTPHTAAAAALGIAVLLNIDAEVDCCPGEAGGIALADRAELPLT